MIYDSLRYSEKKILVLGDLMLDHYLFGSCERVSPEAPVPIIDVNRESYFIGGAGNVVKNLIGLGCSASIISVIGTCNISKEITKHLKNSGVCPDYLITEQGRISSKKTRVISSHNQVLRFDSESKDPVSPLTEEKILERFYKIYENFDLIILSDYGKGVLTDRICHEVIQAARRKSVKVIVDPKGTDYSKYKDAYLLTPNKKEASEATGININDESNLKKALLHLKQNLSLDISLITLSEDGIAFLDNEFAQLPTASREVFDVTGAGDTVIASLGFAIANNLTLKESVFFANLAAGIVIGKIGASSTSLEEIIQYHANYDKFFFEKNLISHSNLENFIEELKLRKKKIVFTNGCFDIIHSGHIKYLKEASQLGDILIVGINSDDSIRELKGSSRPINNLDDRVCVLSAMEFVDFVIPFEEQTPLNLIKLIKPDVLVKGGDYKNKKVVGSNLVKDVRLIDFVKGKSSTLIINKIKEAL